MSPGLLPISGAGCFSLAALVFVFLKLGAAATQITLSRGDYRRTPDTPLFRAVYLVGKVTPALAAISLCIAAIVQHDRMHSWTYGILALCLVFLAAFVVRLRKQRRFFGLFDLLARKQP